MWQVKLLYFQTYVKRVLITHLSRCVSCPLGPVLQAKLSVSVVAYSTGPITLFLGFTNEHSL